MLMKTGILSLMAAGDGLQLHVPPASANRRPRASKRSAIPGCRGQRKDSLIHLVFDDINAISENLAMITRENLITVAGESEGSRRPIEEINNDIAAIDRLLQENKPKSPPCSVPPPCCARPTSASTASKR